MWLFEKRGFISTVAYDPKKDKNKDSRFRTIAKKAGTHLLVRSRIEEDLDWLKTAVPGLVVETDASADYAYRAVISRAQYKKALCAAVDAIDYDSHFKEAARDNSPQAKGRYNAMLDVWTAMSKLQPIAPWSGLGGWGKDGSTSYRTDASYADLFSSIGETESAPYRNGGGPKTGFQAGDRVVGYSGAGEVVEVAPGEVERVKVAYDSGRTATVLSNYLMLEPEADDGADAYDMDYVYEFAKRCLAPGATAQAQDFPSDQLGRLDDAAFELLTRVQEAEESNGDFTVENLDEVYDEILWEHSSDAERIDIWQDAAEVPAKYEVDAVNLFTSLEV